jgi:DNA-binding NarL/FixJ family response regulator
MGVPVGNGCGHVRVLFVDPSEEARRVFEEAIRDYPFIECHSVEQVGASTPLRENPDVVLIQLPANGSAAIPVGQMIVRAATIFPRSTILILNGDADTRLREHALTSGVSGFLSKSAPPDSMAAAILLASRGIAVLPRAAFEQLRQAARNGGASVRAARRKSATDQGAVRLTLRQKQVVQLLLEGLSNKEIAHRLGITESTVKVHVRSIMGRAGVMSRTQLVLSVLRHAD